MALFGSKTKSDEKPAERGEGSAATPGRGSVTQSTVASDARVVNDPAATATSQPARESRPGSDSRTQTASPSRGGESMANIGQSIVFKGELTGDEDLEIDGQVEGNVNLTNNQLTVGANGRLKAEVHAKSIVVIGQVHGNLSATERIEIQATGVVEGDIHAPRLLVQEGASLNGRIDMGKGSAGASKTGGAPAPKGEAPAEVRKSA